MRRGLLTLLGLCVLITLITAAPEPVVPPPSSTLDLDDPSAGDPTSPPKSISFPTARASQPAIIPTQPSQCDGQNPSDDCLNALSGSGGYIWFDKDSECSNTQKSQLQTALWDATTLAFYSSNFPSSGEGNRGLQAGRFYVGPDFAQFQSRISGNLKRAWEFKTDKTSEKAYITTSCKDTKNICGKTIDGKAVGGYAWTINGWFGYYHYITLCQTFFSLETLDAKLADVEKELASGSTRMAQDMTWLRSTGQFFLHEMMHTRIADGGVEPHIIDEFVAPIPSGEKPGTNDIKAYGPRLVHKLAARSLDQGGGATRASTNADSYAILANAIWWWDTTGYFPGVPGKNNPATAQDDFDDADFPVSLYMDLGNDTDLATVDFDSLYSTDLTAFGDGPPDPDDEVSGSLAPASVSDTPTAI